MDGALFAQLVEHRVGVEDLLYSVGRVEGAEGVVLLIGIRHTENYHMCSDLATMRRAGTDRTSRVALPA